MMVFSEDDLEVSEIGLCPKSLELKSLREVTSKCTSKVGDAEFNVFSAVNTKNLILSEDYFDKQVFSKNIDNYIIVRQNDFAYNPARVNIGFIRVNDFDSDACVSPAYVAFKTEKGYENFMNMFIKTPQFNKWVNTLASGSVRQTLNYKDFSLIKLAYPPIEYVNKFNELYNTYHKINKHNLNEIRKLEDLRDILLPKLMSGDIDVSRIKSLKVLKNIIINYEKIMI